MDAPPDPARCLWTCPLSSSMPHCSGALPARVRGSGRRPRLPGLPFLPGPAAGRSVLLRMRTRCRFRRELRASPPAVVPPGEAGLLLTKVSSRNPFFGYRGPREMTERKLVRGVRRTGDVYVNTGDVLAMDDEGFLYFRDRLGDTFRWKGENVSTREVEGVLAHVDGLEEVNVYGVPVPGCEGKVGMAAVKLAPGRTLDGPALYRHVQASLPSYAVPRFIRIQDHLELTNTFKHVKSRLVREGFDADVVADRLFVLDHQAQAFSPLTPDAYRAVCDGSWKL